MRLWIGEPGLRKERLGQEPGECDCRGGGTWRSLARLKNLGLSTFKVLVNVPFPHKQVQ